MTAPALPLPDEPMESDVGLAPEILDQIAAASMAPPITADGLDAIRAEMDRLPAFSLTIGSPQGEAEDTAFAEPPPPATAAAELAVPGAQQGETDPDARRMLVVMYGDGFPLGEADEPEPDRWVAWALGLWQRHGPPVEPRLHMVDRNRMFRAGDQWVSSNGGGPWRQPPKPRDVTRVVDNVIGPALDQRVEIVSEQRPGFRCAPQSQDQRHMKKAEAQQVFAEHQYERQHMERVIRESAYWAGTDGVAYLHTYYDPDAGAWDEFTSRPQGDMVTEVLRVEQVRVSAGSSATRAPWYWAVRRPVSRAQAVKDYGKAAVDGVAHPADGTGGAGASAGRPSSPWTRGPDDDLEGQESVDELTVYCERSEALPQGLIVKCVGAALVAGPMPLPAGLAPVARVTDGTTDPAWVPVTLAESQGWYDHQMRINALRSTWIDSVRLNKGARLLARAGKLKTDTLVSGTMVIHEVETAGPIGDAVQVMGANSVGVDVKEALAQEIQAFERKSGWNDASRGSFTGDVSGRSVLAQREMLERIFAPPVNAMAQAMARWAEIQIAYGRAYYDTPRIVSVQGAGRPDLARELTADDLDGVANVLVDPETLMPLPRALRLHLLDTMLDKQLISPAEYRRRVPFAFTANLDTPDTDHYARAKRAAECIRQSANPNPPECPVLWMDNEAIHQDTLERELLLPDDIAQPIKSAAYQRWMMLAQQAAAKSGAAPMPGATPSGGGKGKAGGGDSGAPVAFQGTSPGIAAGTSSTIGQPMSGNDTNASANRFDMTQKQ